MKIDYQKEIDGESKNFDLQIIKNKNFFEIKCLSQNDEEMGFITFEIHKNFVWIYKIETNENFYHQGVASAILDVAEYIAVEHNAHTMQGKFVPDNEYARPFYEKNGYTVPNKEKNWDTYDPGWILYKCLDDKIVKSKVAHNLTICDENTLGL